MAIDDALAGLDPYDLMDREAERIEAFARSLSGADWDVPSACEGWSRHDLLSHLVATEDYFHAGLAGTVGDLIMRYVEQGATDVHSFNALGVAAGAEVDPAELLETWVAADAETRAGMRARDGADVDTSIGDYPARWQTFHLAGELATHADDLGVPVTDGEAADRLAWRARFSCFALAETKPGVEARLEAGEAVVTDTDGVEHRYDLETFVAGVAARLGDDVALDEASRAMLSTMP